jgi:hypothetical protein
MTYPKLTATLPTTNDISNATNWSGKKELIDAMSVIVVTPDKRPQEVCTARWYMGRSREASVVYASIWVRRPAIRNAEDTGWAKDSAWWSGSGNAGGYGYHKQSAALHEAIGSAGITLSRSVSGTGECEEALLAIAKAMFPRLKDERFLIVRH